jgi:BirA family biotin operon repressor/biotin-[acetyl-CoA-carboxylase] ligase
MSGAVPPALRVERHALVTSTNDLARAAAERGAAEGLWVLAAAQSAGRGRQGRSWRSPPGNFHGSLLLRPDRPLAEVASLSLVAALAVAEAVEEVTAGRVAPRAKWPNDVLVGRAKLAGILAEAIAGPGGRCAALVLGIGVNLAAHPEDLGRPTTSLAAQGLEPPTPEAFLPVLAARLAARLAAWRAGGFAALRGDWLGRAVGLGEPVELEAGGLVHRGRLADLGSDGSILLESPAGCLERFTAGELLLGAGPEASSAAPGRL